VNWTQVLGIREVIVVASRTPQGTLAGYQWNRRPGQMQRGGFPGYRSNRSDKKIEACKLNTGCWLTFGEHVRRRLGDDGPEKLRSEFPPKVDCRVYHAVLETTN
jgi:hypothetical protein